ncbi:hypothetical protein GDO78_013541 [Eleutherodactylus coqui]|uniref:Uncharacterized protein n=1 Tax=Eleutherodactylus coqui TaxID=57060 RepID=A0A8J6F019_ELECQ|nr:hypothetical protein GDO78_013541 [Eleutherodactylus coqui]
MDNNTAIKLLRIPYVSWASVRIHYTVHYTEHALTENSRVQEDRNTGSNIYTKVTCRKFHRAVNVFIPSLTETLALVLALSALCFEVTLF